MTAAATPEEAQILLERGAGLYEAGKLYDALACWKQVLELDPGNEIALEYLRFIEDNFQIGVDAFMAQHQSMSVPPPPPPPVSRAPQASAEEALGDLDWSEILEDPEQGSVAPAGRPPVSVSELDDDEDFFSALDPSSMSAPPGDEGQAWAETSVPSAAPLESLTSAPPLELDPLSMDDSAFAEPLAPPMEERDLEGGLLGPPRRVGPDRDLARLSDDSLEVLLDQDFKAWEEEDLTQASPAQDSTVAARAAAPRRAEREEHDFFARPFDEATPPPLPAPSPDDSLGISPHPSEAELAELGVAELAAGLNAELEDEFKPRRTPPSPARGLKARLATPAPARLVPAVPDPDEVPFELASSTRGGEDSVEIPLDDLMAAAESHGRGTGPAASGEGSLEDPFAALEDAFSSLSDEIGALDDSGVGPPLAPPVTPAAVAPGVAGPAASRQPPQRPGGPINFDESLPAPAAPPHRTPPPPARAAWQVGVGELDDGEGSLPDVDFGMVAAAEAALSAADSIDAYALDDDDLDFVLEDDDPAPVTPPPRAVPAAELGFDAFDEAADASPLDWPDSRPPAPMPSPSPPAPGPSRPVTPPVTPPPRMAAPAPPAPSRGAAGVNLRRGSVPPPRPVAERSEPPQAEISQASPPPDDELQAFLRQGLAEIEAVESGTSEVGVTDRGPPGIRQLIKAPPPGTDFDGLMVEARRRQQAGDFTGSLALVEQVLAGQPDHREAQAYLTENTTRLLAMYRSRLGKLSKAPKLKLRPQEIIWQSLDHRAGFVLAQVDGMTSYEDIIEIAGMDELEATRILARLVDHGVIG